MHSDAISPWEAHVSKHPPSQGLPCLEAHTPANGLGCVCEGVLLPLARFGRSGGGGELLPFVVRHGHYAALPLPQLTLSQATLPLPAGSAAQIVKAQAGGQAKRQSGDSAFSAPKGRLLSRPPRFRKRNRRQRQCARGPPRLPTTPPSPPALALRSLLRHVAPALPSRPGVRGDLLSLHPIRPSPANSLLASSPYIPSHPIPSTHTFTTSALRLPTIHTLFSSNKLTAYTVHFSHSKQSTSASTPAPAAGLLLERRKQQKYAARNSPASPRFAPPHTTLLQAYYCPTPSAYIHPSHSLQP